MVSISWNSRVMSRSRSSFASPDFCFISEVFQSLLFHEIRCDELELVANRISRTLPFFTNAAITTLASTTRITL